MHEKTQIKNKMVVLNMTFSKIIMILVFLYMFFEVLRIIRKIKNDPPIAKSEIFKLVTGITLFVWMIWYTFTHYI